MLERLEAYLFAHYDFRFNVLTEQSEYAPKGYNHYQLVDQRALNTLCIEARAAGINCWDKDVSRLLCSQKIADFHPFTHYMEHLPQWDGTDRVRELARRVSDTPVWLNGFHRWMLAMVAQWMKMDSQCANAVAPLLISTEQGRCKSTFCSCLLPQELQAFYKQSPVQEIFHKCFRLPADEKEGRLMTAAEIFCRLQKKFPAALRTSNASQMGKMLQALGVQRTHTRQGNAYLVVPV